MLVAAYYWSGGMAIFWLVRCGTAGLHTSPFILDEVERTLREKFGWAYE